jgi:hypothetical protein
MLGLFNGLGTSNDLGKMARSVHLEASPAFSYGKMRNFLRFSSIHLI